tara:strand:- start:4419 stop:6233 length:1815 start_codon:yes stop_codon:yes gene_type:complete
MALFTPSQSPAVVVKEIDATGGVPNVQTSTGAIVGNFRWGPVEQRTLISNEADLINVHSTPDTTNTIDFHNASYFLRYSSSLQVVRAITSHAKNSRAGGAIGGGTPATAEMQTGGDHTATSAPTVKNKDNFTSQEGILNTDKQSFIARFPGALGNSLQISVCTPTLNDSAFDNWAYKSSFDAAPGSSALDSAAGGSKTEVHVAVIDEDGQISGTKGTVLETYPYVSVASNSKAQDGGSNFMKTVINERSQYIHMVGFPGNITVSAHGILAGTAMTGTQQDFIPEGANIKVLNYSLDSGVNSNALGTAEIATGHDLFEDVEAVEVDFLIAPGMEVRSDQTTVTNDLIANATARKDCVVVSSPCRSDVVGQSNETTVTTNVVATAATITKSSYGIMDCSYLKVFDKFNDQFIEIPAASSVAGLMAETDRTQAPWFSPAGTRRGQLLGVTGLNYNPNKTNRDTLYKAGVNPVVNVSGSGICLFGDKTLFNRPSAFDRINCRRLFLTLERAIAQAAKNVMFEFNDEFTRAEFVNIIEPVLRDVKARRGITDFRVIADETVNTAEVIDRNEFIANIFIKPARSINFVTLNFVAVRTGVSFEEIVGTAGV